jgi:hypothetical protein
MLCVLPLNVGEKGFYGHRVYAAFSHLVNTTYIAWLDQDNWMEESHIADCIDTMTSTLCNGEKLDWCYSLRSICDEAGNYVCHDDCESLGKWETYLGGNHIDTNVYFVKTDVAIRMASTWHGGWGQDRIVFSVLLKTFPNFTCTSKYTINYRTAHSNFFIEGNGIMRNKYIGQQYPWC